MKNWLRRKLLNLIGDDIDRIAREAYDDGCYFTSRQLEFRHLTAQNQKLMEILSEKVSITIPDIVVRTDALPQDKTND